MPSRYIEGDLFDHDYDHSCPTVIAHVANDEGVMGKGFVVPLAQHFPWAKEAYVNWFKDNPLQCDTEILGEVGSPSRGQTQMVTVKRSDQALPPTPDEIESFRTDSNWEDRIVVANMVAQDLGSARPLYYNDLARCMDQVANSREIVDGGGEIICPMFGSGLASGDWNFIEQLIVDCWLKRDIDVTVYYFEKFLPDNWSLPKPMQK